MCSKLPSIRKILSSKNFCRWLHRRKFKPTNFCVLWLVCELHVRAKRRKLITLKIFKTKIFTVENLRYVMIYQLTVGIVRKAAIISWLWLCWYHINKPDNVCSTSDHFGTIWHTFVPTYIIDIPQLSVVYSDML